VKFYNIMLFMFILNLFAGVITQFGIFDAGPHKIDEGGITPEHVNQSVEDINTLPEQGGILGTLSFLVENVRLIIAGVKVFLTLAVNALLVKPILQQVLCITSCSGPVHEIINIMSWLTRFVYAVGLVQIVTGRNFKAAQ